MTDPTAPVNVISFDSSGNAYFSGTITAQNIQKISTASAALGDSPIKDSSSAAALSLLKDLLSVISLSNSGEITLATDTFFNRFVTFLDTVSFKKDLNIQGRPTFNSDTGGYAVIRKEGKSVTVVFEREFKSTPVVNAAITLENQQNEEDNSASEEAVLGTNIQYLVSKVTNKGFTITLNKKASSDIRFSWTALAIDKAKTSIGFPLDISTTPIVTIIPTTVPQITSFETPTTTATPSPGL